MAGHPQLKVVVAGEVEAIPPESQGPAGALPLLLFAPHQGTGRKEGGPACRIREIRQQIPALIRIQPEGARGSLPVTALSKHRQRQADMAAPQLMAGERGPQHQLGAAAQVGHQPGKLQVKLADAPRQRQGFQPLYHGFALHLAPHASALFDFSKR